MQRIIIENFGPLKKIDLEIKDYMVFIGPNASGKSTLVKLLHFFHCIPSRIAEVLLDFFGDENFKKEFIPYQSAFIYYNQIFPQKSANTNIRFYYNEQLNITLDFSKNSGSSTPLPFVTIFSDDLNKLILELIDLKIFFESKLDDEKNPAEIKSNSFLIVKGSFQKEMEKLIDYRLNSLASSSKIFIPENRSNSNTFEGDWGEQIKSSIFYLKSFFSESAKFPEIITKILKGIPIEFNKNEFGVKSNEGEIFRYNILSSGQKNAFWLVLVLFQKSLIAFSHNNIIIEEPETNLFPDSQNLLTELITKLANNSNNRIIVTTHSHYILGTINTLLNAHRIGQTHPEKVNELINRNLWIDNSKLYAGYLNNGTIKNIFDNDAKMLEIVDLTKIVGDLNEQLDNLFDIEFESADVK